MKEARICCFVKLVFAFYYILKVKGDALQITQAELYFSNTAPSHQEVIHVPEGVATTLPCPGKGDGSIRVTWLRNSFIIGHENIFDPTSETPLQRSKRELTRSRIRGRRETTEYSSASNFSTAYRTSTSQICNKCFIAQSQQRQQCCILSNGSLQLISNTSNNGYYQCIISNKVGSLVSNRVQLLSLSNASILNIFPSASVANGQSVRLTCRSGDVTDQPSSITWYKDDDHLQINDQHNKHLILPDGVLHIFDVLPQDVGNYKCTVRNRYAEYHSNHLKLSINDKLLPAVADGFGFSYTSQHQITCIEGETCTLECLPRNDGKVEWLKQGITVCVGSLEECVEKKSALMFNNVNASISGNYTCKVIHGGTLVEQQQSFQVTVKVKPSIKYVISRTTTEELPLLDDLTLYCYHPKQANVHLQWLFNGVPIPLGSLMRRTVSEFPQGDGHFKLELEIENLMDEDEGFYQCVAEGSNDYMINTTRLVFTNKIAASPPTNIRWNVGQTDADLYWSNPEEYSVMAYYVIYARPQGMKAIIPEPKLMKEGEAPQFHIENLYKNTNYTAIVVVLLDSGSMVHSTVHFQTKEGVPSGKVNNARTVATIGTTALLAWEPLHKEERGSVIINYLLILHVDRNHVIHKDVPANLDAPDSTVYALLTGLNYTVKEDDVYAYEVLAASSKGSASKDFLNKPVHFKVEKNLRHCMFYKDQKRNVSMSWTLDQELGFINVNWKIPDHTASVNASPKLTSLVTGEEINVYEQSMDEAKFHLQNFNGTFKLNVTFTDASTSCHLAEFILLKPLLEKGLSVRSAEPTTECIKLSWPPQNVTKYSKYSIRALTKYAKEAVYKSSVKNEDEICGLKDNTVYLVSIAGMNDNSQTSYGESRTVKTLKKGPSIVRHLDVVSTANFSYVVNWLAPSDGGVNGYSIELKCLENDTLIKKSGSLEDTVYRFSCIDPRINATVEVIAFDEFADESSPVAFTIYGSNDQNKLIKYNEICNGIVVVDPNVRLSNTLKIVIVVAFVVVLCLIVCILMRKGHLRCFFPKRDHIYIRNNNGNGHYNMNGHSATNPGVNDHLINHHINEGCANIVQNGHTHSTPQQNGNGHIGNGHHMNGRRPFTMNRKKASKSNEPCWKKAKKHFPHAVEATTASFASLRRHHTSTGSNRERNGSKLKFFPTMKFRQPDADYKNTPAPHEETRCEERVVLSILTPLQSLNNQAGQNDTAVHQPPPPSSDSHKTGDNNVCAHQLDEVIVTDEPLSLGETDELQTSAVPLLPSATR